MGRFHSSARAVLTALFVALMLVPTGCLRNRLLDRGEGFRDHPALPRQNFGRPSEQRGQAGFDQRARDIESSLGVEDRPPRFD